ncbi:glycine cleavage system aminomethyltransferase GcvT [Thiotrichales bacterium 19S3-7]|nr:glycine cleavage system aminomethyltransferase GcvT [Thiotrichales bacterium 19S3-7]MCF6801336.1 glycine cleavage system aminomethyltransferase GcvT [Thiotrichales bacterium 19S3-11]
MGQDTNHPLKTPLYDWHVEHGAKMVPFAGWQMPIDYGSQIEEHHAVRKDKGIFDVSHMLAVDLSGERVCDFLSYLVANDVRKIASGKALYTCMLNEKGGVIDDLIIYHISESQYRLVVNAGNRQKDVNWIKTQAALFNVSVQTREDLSIIAVQGPNAREAVISALDDDMVFNVAELKPFRLFKSDEMLIARTGYTGEDGFEIMLEQEKVVEFWQKLIDQGVKACGLGARDTLRLEAGLNLYGNDMLDDITPFECGLDWTVSLTDDRDFIGKSALVTQKNNGITSKFIGLILLDRGVLRAGQKVVSEQGEGIITSGSFSPTLNQSIALARIPIDATECQVEIRNRKLALKMVSYPFVRKGNVVFKSLNHELELVE